MGITVILPTYNRRAFLPRALACICGQTYRDWRLLVVNDGGEDVADLVEACHDDRIEYHDRPHLGKSAQLNYALGLVKTKYVAYMDDDDDVFPEHLARLHAAAEEIGADFVFSDSYTTVLDPSGRVVSRSAGEQADAPYESLRLFNRVNHKQVLHTKELSDRVGGYDENMRILIDFDYVKRLVKAARRSFHLREITGEHFLRIDPEAGTYGSISGLWKRDPEGAGRSLLAFFEKDPAALATLYRTYNDCMAERNSIRHELDSGWIGFMRRFFSRRARRRHRAAGVFRDALPVTAQWREVPLSGGLRGFFRLADESVPAIAAVNALPEGGASADRERLCDGSGMPYSVARPAFEATDLPEGVRFRSRPGAPRRWIMLTAGQKLPEDFALEFDYLPHAVFREQLQFDFRMSSLGDRLRFMVRDNASLGVNAVERGTFCCDAKTVPFSFPIGVRTPVRIESCRGVHVFYAGGRNLMSVAYEGGAGRTGRHAALVFYDSAPTADIDFELLNFRFFVKA